MPEIPKASATAANRRMWRLLVTSGYVTLGRACSAAMTFAAIILAVPLAITYVETGLVPRVPTAILSTGLMLLAKRAQHAIDGFVGDILATERGWMLIILGHAIGFVFAAVVLCTTVVAFPLLLDRDVGAYEAIHASFRAVIANPIPMAAWGLIVAALLIAGSLPLFAGLAVVLPILGHSTWHLYRKVVEPAPAAKLARAKPSASKASKAKPSGG